MIRWMMLLVLSIVFLIAQVQAQFIHPLDTLGGYLLKSESSEKSLAPQINSVRTYPMQETTQNTTADYSISSEGFWFPLGAGLNNTVWAVASSYSAVYAGGSFTNYVAKWNGIYWQTLGGGVSGSISPVVNSLAIDSPSVYVGGSFYYAGAVLANAIARWDGGAWHALGTGLDDDRYNIDAKVNAIKILGGYVYAAGAFTHAGGLPAKNIARWNGSTWEQVGSGFNGAVRALEVMNGNLYAVGSFDSSGTTRLPHIAMWDGSTWQPVGTGFASDLYALATNGTVLYAGGYFTNAGGVPVKSIARWNGSLWDSLGSGITFGTGAGIVYSLTVSNSDLIVGGFFDGAGGQPANNVAKWTGTKWRPLDNGVNNFVFAAHSTSAEVYFGGNFTNANGMAVSNIVHFRNIGTTDIDIFAGWNLVSVPRVQSDYRSEVIFPDEFGDPLEFVPGMGYIPASILQLARGYWLRYLSAKTVTVIGPAPGSIKDTVTQAGWAIIGSRASVVEMSSLILSNDAEIFGDLIGFDPVTRMYYPTTVINPGQGVWIRVTKACSITLPE